MDFFISDALAQAAPAAQEPGFAGLILPLGILLVFFFLLLDVCPHSVFILTNCGNVITSCPKILADKVLLSALKVASNLDGAFAFDKTHNLGNCVFGWNRKHDVDVIWHEMPFDHCTFLLSCQFSKYLTQIFPQVAEDRFLAILRYPYDMVLAIPLGVA